jgi:hypothetical protein
VVEPLTVLKIEMVLVKEMMLNEIEQPHFKMIEDCVDETYLSVI